MPGGCIEGFRGSGPRGSSSKYRGNCHKRQLSYWVGFQIPIVKIQIKKDTWQWGSILGGPIGQVRILSSSEYQVPANAHAAQAQVSNHVLTLFLYILKRVETSN